MFSQMELKFPIFFYLLPPRLCCYIPVPSPALTGSTFCIPSAHTCLCWRAALGDAPGPFACGPESQKGLEIYILPGAAP